MSGFVGKVVNTLIVVILVVVCLVSLRDMILTDNAVQDAFVAIFEPLPFSGQIAELICKTMGYQLGFQTQQAANTFLDILVDLVKIFAMTIVNPLIIRPVARLFLRVPDYLSWQDREAYMERPGYRVKECLIMVLLTPLSAYLASLATGKLLGMVYAKVGFGGLVLVSVVSLVLMILLSCLVLTIFGNFKFGFVLRYRLGFQLIDGLLKVVGINILCIFAGLAFYNDHGSQGLMMILLLCIYLAGIDLLMGSVFQPKGA